MDTGVFQHTSSHGDKKEYMWLTQISRYSFLLLGLLVPLWFLPLSSSIDFSREMLFGGLLLLSLAAWLTRALLRGEIVYRKSIINLSLLVIVLIGGLSTLLSKAPYVAFLSTDVVGERFLVMIFYVVATVLAFAVLKEKKDVSFFSLLLIGGGAVSALVTLLGFFNVYLLPLPIAQRIDFNVIGTINALALFYAFLLTLSAGFFVGMRDVIKSLPMSVKVGFGISAVLFILNLLVINFLTAWIGLLVGTLGILWVYLHDMRKAGELNQAFRNMSFYSIVALLVLSVVFITIRSPLIPSIQFSAEISPSFSATTNIAWKTMTEGTKNFLLGSGPGTFAYNYSLYRDPIINQTIVWGVRFGQGQSYLTTVLSTMGILGFLVLVLFGLLSLAVFVRNIMHHAQRHALAGGLFGGLLTLLVSWVLYAGNFTLLLMSFITVGLLLTLLPEDDSRWGIRNAETRFTTPWAVFVFSLVMVFLAALSIGGIYFEGKRYTAAVRFQDAVTHFQQTGNVDDTITGLQTATNLDPFNDQYQRFVSQGYILKVQNLINATLQGKNSQGNVQQDFQSAVTSAVNSFQTALHLNPIESFNWRTAGSLYETLIPLVRGADQSAINAYSQAIALDPTNPTAYLDIGRAYMAIADTAQGLAGQGGVSAQDAKQFNDLRTQSLQKGADALQQATTLKSDYGASHFLLSQIAIRQGNLDLAISTTEKARIAAPQDIGVAFQLGLLYYQKREFDKAEAEFLRAVGLNDNYSNARYFLGLILDQQGKTDEAIQQFEKIQALNPDNQEVKKILDNLHKGKAALSGIAPAPEKRTSLPVKEAGGSDNSPIQKKK